MRFATSGYVPCISFFSNNFRRLTAPSADAQEDRLLKPLALECLAHPSGICARGDGNVVYVAETMANRVLRFVRRSNDVYHCSVYHQFNGGLGPTALCMDSRERLFVARYEFAELGENGTMGSIVIFDNSGQVALEVPDSYPPCAPP